MAILRSSAFSLHDRTLDCREATIQFIAGNTSQRTMPHPCSVTSPNHPIQQSFNIQLCIYNTCQDWQTETKKNIFFNVLLTVHLSIILVINQLNAQILDIISLLYTSTCFEDYVLIIRRSTLYYTASGIITPADVPTRPVHGTATYRCDTRCCMIQFWPPDDEHIVLETCRGI